MTMHTQLRGEMIPRGWRAPQLTFDAVMIFALALIVLLLVISAASQAFAPPPVPSTVNLNDSDGDKQVVLNRGETPVVSLSGNPTTGYQWLLEASIGLILLGLMGFRSLHGLPTSGLTVTLGIIAATWGVLDLARSVVGLSLEPSFIFAALLIVLGLTLLGTGVLRSRQA